MPDRDRPSRYLVVIPLRGVDLQLATTAEHAFAILDNQTVFSANDAEVFDVEGNRVSKSELRRVLNRTEDS